MILKKNKIGILGGTFDPAHKGHLAISKEAKKRFRLNKIIWAITKKNPFKKKSKENLLIRMRYCKKLTRKLILLRSNFMKIKLNLTKLLI